MYTTDALPQILTMVDCKIYADLVLKLARLAFCEEAQLALWHKYQKEESLFALVLTTYPHSDGIELLLFFKDGTQEREIHYSEDKEMQEFGTLSYLDIRVGELIYRHQASNLVDKRP